MTTNSDVSGRLERLLQHGPATLSDAELVAVILAAGHPGATALDVADSLLRAVGGVPGLSRQHPEALCRLPGLSKAAAARVVAALALSSRRDTMGTVTVACTADLVPVFRPALAGLRHERLVVAAFDRRLRVLAVRPVTDGNAESAPLCVRDIIATVLRHDGHAFAIAHNHPTGDPTPSDGDRAASRSCAAAAAATGLQFFGHIVIGEHDTWADAHIPTPPTFGLFTAHAG